MPSFPEAISFDDEYFRFGPPEPGALVFDLGANIGLVSYALANAVGQEGQVIAFEPDPQNFEYLSRNMARHGLRQVQLVNEAIAPHSGELAFFAEGTITSGLASARHESLMPTAVGAVTLCNAVTLRDAVERYGAPAWIKMDIEGAEIDVLRGSLDLLARHRPFLVIDTSHFVDGEMTSRRIEQLLRSIGYSAETASPGGFPITWGRPT